ncbi:MAG: PIN domain-containing protein [Terriglobales bacterium]
MILLDTHVLIWAAIEPKRLSRAAVSALRRARATDGMAVASITLWETASLFARGRIESTARWRRQSARYWMPSGQL